MQYTDLKPYIEEAHSIKIDRAPNHFDAKASTAYFCKNYLGIQPYTWQYLFWKKVNSGEKRIIIASSRQVGKSIAIAILALHAAIYNTRPAGINKKTHIGIISATDEQSKKLMLEIRRLIQVGDDRINLATKGETKGFLSKYIDNSVDAANNKTTITFKNGNTIVCLPPTDRVRGYSFSYLFVDEAAFIEDANIFFQCIEPTISKTDGVIVLSSTPNGMQGFYYEIFDPEDKLKEHEYERLWVHYTCLDDTKHIELIEEKRKFYTDTGRVKEFQQEYDALFTSQVSAFFATEDIDNAIDKTLECDSFHKGPTHLGIDFGMINSNTVISISFREKDKVKLIYQYIYLAGSDNDLLNDIKKLITAFTVEKVIVDSCPEGYYLIQQMKAEGIPITEMSFRTEKIAKYVALRSKLKKGLIKIYNDKELIRQMKALQQIQTPSTVKIEKPSGGKDDAVDSLLLSCYHYIEDEILFDSSIVTYPRVQNPLGDKFIIDQDMMEEALLWGAR